MQHRLITLLCHASMRGSHPLPDQLLGSIQVHISFGAVNFHNDCNQCCHTHAHSQVQWLIMFQREGQAVMIWIFDLRLNIATDIALPPFKPTSMF